MTISNLTKLIQNQRIILMLIRTLTKLLKNPILTKISILVVGLVIG